MSALVHSARHDAVLLLTVDNPPVNALTTAVAEALATEVRQAASDDSIQAIVIMGQGRTFVAGADIREFARIVAGEAPPLNLYAQFSTLEDSPKPVIMALHGSVLGGGLELAMAGHYRIAAPKTQLGQPEVKLGLIPGAGGTQRLPRLVGVDKALEMCVFGAPISAETALEWGLIDEIATGDLLQAALACARKPVRRTRDLVAKLADGPQAESLAGLHADAARKRLKGQAAPLAAVEAVAATARLSFDEGQELESRLFNGCLHSEQSRALIHLFFGERTVAKIPSISKEVKGNAIRRAAVIGAGTMGAGITICLVDAGIPVLLKDSTQDALDRGMSLIRKHFEAAAAKGRITPEQVEHRVARVTPTLSYDGMRECELVIEAVFEELALKQHVFAEVHKHARKGAILATNTSTIDIDLIASATEGPEAVIGTHFFSPAPVMRLLEIVQGKRSSPEAVMTGMELAKVLKKVGVLSGNCYGFIGNRMFMPYRDQAITLVEEGASPQQVDRVLTDFGMAMGPLAVGDLSGIDVFCSMRREGKRRGHSHSPEMTFEDHLFTSGRLGQKVGVGWYRYDDKRKASVDPQVEYLLREYTSEQAIPQREVREREILDRTLLALINEGARILGEGIAQRAVDIDIVYTCGYGFPAWRGGPMCYAESLGLGAVLDSLRALYDEFGPVWKPAARLEEAMKRGKWD